MKGGCITLEPKVVIDNNGSENTFPDIIEAALAKADDDEMVDLIHQLVTVYTNQQETIEYLTRKLYGRSKETLPFKGQFTLFNEIEAEYDPNESEPDLEDILPEKKEKGNGKKTKKRSTHDEMLEGIPTEKVVITLKGEDRICEWCGNEMEVLGEKYVREELHIVPAKIKRVQIYQETLICKHCKEDDAPVIVAPKTPDPLFDKSMAAPSSVSWIITEKFMKHVPTYRLEQQLKQAGVRLRRSTMSKWLIKVTDNYLEGLYDLMVDEQLKRNYLHADETPCQVLKEPDRAPTQKSYIWLYATGDDGLPPILIYDYNPSRSHTVPGEYLKDYHGYLHTDCYDGYNALEEHLTRCTCWAHLRRYWFDAISTDLQKQIKKGDIDQDNPGSAVIGFLYCDKLFEYEKKYKDLSPDERKAERLKTELPIINKFFAWVKTLKPLGGSKLEKAVTYSLNNEATFRNYLKDGHCSLSNNFAERCAKTYVMGRKNFLFHDTQAGAKSSIILYSLVETARANNLNVYRYIWLVLTALSGYKKQLANIADYLPWTEFIQSRCHISVVGTNEEEDYE